MFVFWIRQSELVPEYNKIFRLMQKKYILDYITQNVFFFLKNYSR